MCPITSVCLPVCCNRALDFESIDLETSEYLGQIRTSRSSGQGQGHRSRKIVYASRSRSDF